MHVITSIHIFSLFLSHFTTGHRCLTLSESQIFIDRWDSISRQIDSDLGSPRITGEKIIESDFHLYSGSAKALSGHFPADDARSLLFPSRDAFLGSNLKQPPVSVTKTLHLTSACTDIVQLLESNNRKGNMSFPSRGVVIFGMRWDDQKNIWRVQRAEIEFDSISLLLEMGGMIRLPDGKVIDGGKRQTEDQ